MHRRSSRSRIPIIVGILASLIFLGTGSVALAVGYQPVVINVDGAKREIHTGARSPLAIIRQAGIVINPRDRIEEGINGDNRREITVTRAYPKVIDNQGIPELKWEYEDSQKSVPVIIHADENLYRTIAQPKSSARSLVHNVGVSLTPLDRVKIKETGGQTELYVERVNRNYQNKTTVVAAPVEKIEDKELEKGKEKVESEGRDGLSQTVIFTEIVNGKIISGGQEMGKTLIAAQPKIVKIGVKAPADGVVVPNVTAPVGQSQEIAHSLVLGRGWDEREFSCLVQLWNRESGWRTNAANSSGAYGIPQALPGKKMASFGADWQTNPETQIKWGLSYVGNRYGSPCGAWAFFRGHNYY